MRPVGLQLSNASVNFGQSLVNMGELLGLTTDELNLFIILLYKFQNLCRSPTRDAHANQLFELIYGIVCLDEPLFESIIQTVQREKTNQGVHGLL